MKSFKDTQGPEDLLRRQAMTPLEERVLTLRYGPLAPNQTQLADGSMGDADLSAWLLEIERDVLRRAKLARSRTGITAVLQGGAATPRGARPSPFGRRRHLRLVPPTKG